MVVGAFVMRIMCDKCRNNGNKLNLIFDDYVFHKMLQLT